MPPGLPPHHAATQSRARKGAQLILKGMVLNAVLALVKVGGGALGHSYALTADGVESLLDVGVSFLVWAGFQWAAQPPDRDHPYGHGKADAVAGLLTGFFVVAAGIGIAWQAVLRIRHPFAAPHWGTLVVLGAAFIAKMVFSRFLVDAGKETASTALGAEATHHFSDALVSAVAFIGILIAILGHGAYAAADGWAALVASAVILFSGGGILHRALNELMDIAVPVELENDIRAIAAGVAGVSSLDECRVRKSGLSYLVDIQVCVDGDLTVRRGHEIAHAVRDALLASSLRVTDVWVHVEPVR